MNFADIYNKIKSIDEAEPAPVARTSQPIIPRPAPAETGAANNYTPLDQMSPADQAAREARRKADNDRQKAYDAAQDAKQAPAGKDLGNGFTLTTTTVAGRANLPAVLDTQSNTYWIQNKDPSTGGAIIRSPVPYIKVVDGKMASGGGQPGGETTAALQAAGLKESINENNNENFMSLYKQIRAIDEGQMPDEMEECGNMMALPTSMEHDHPAQSDSVTMSVSMNGAGDGGIRDLMNILKGIENVGEPHGDHDATDVMFGSEMEPEMEAFANSMAGASEQTTLPQSAVTDIGSNDGRGDHEAPKANGGGNPYTQVSEELVDKLQELYSQFKVN